MVTVAVPTVAVTLAGGLGRFDLSSCAWATVSPWNRTSSVRVNAVLCNIIFMVQRVWFNLGEGARLPKSVRFGIQIRFKFVQGPTKVYSSAGEAFSRCFPAGKCVY